MSRELLKRLRSERSTPTGRLVKKVLEARLQDTREQLDAAPLDEVQKHQGAIRELKFILKEAYKVTSA